MEAYIVPDWVKLVAGLVIYQRQPELKVLFGLRSASIGAGLWCLPTGIGVIRRDISSVLAEAIRSDESKDFSKSLKDPMGAVQTMSERQQKAFLSPAEFALAEAKWYVKIPPELRIDQFEPLKPICQFDAKSLLVKLYFGLEWRTDEQPRPADTGWPFKEIGFFSKEELKSIPIAFGCEEDLVSVFWS